MKDIKPTLSKHFKMEMSRHGAESNRKKAMAGKMPSHSKEAKLLKVK